MGAPLFKKQKARKGVGVVNGLAWTALGGTTLAIECSKIHEGNVEHIGTPLEVYTKPRTLFTAQFIGSPAMNILKGKSENNKVTFSNNTSLKTNSDYKGSVNIGLRPEDFKLDDNGPIKINVELVELIGSNSLIHGRLDKSDEVLVASVQGVIKENIIGKNIGLSFNESKIHLFDINSGQRIN